jgi:predicted glycoside hydrolase/deacetylase ChbG (UPF0249 family)
VSSKKYLIVNADDFGQSEGVNRGVIEAHRRGLVTSASLMVRWPGAPEAAAYAKQHTPLSLGIHLDFGEWAYRGGEWTPVYAVVNEKDTNAVRGEVARQLEAFRALVGSAPTHVDSHQHAHLREPARSIVLQAARELGVPLRQCDGRVMYCGEFYGQTAEGAPLPGAVTAENLLRILKALPPGVTELGCHPAAESDLDTMYREERREELRVLCDAALRAAVSKLEIELCTFREFPGRVAAAGFECPGS